MQSPPKTRPCAHCILSDALEGGLCEPCSKLPRCEVCEVFFDGLVSQSKENPRRCETDLNYEDRIKFECSIPGCDTQLPLYISRNSEVLHYLVRGNICAPHSGEAKSTSKQAKERKHPQFLGYLALMEQYYAGGKISEEQWRYAIRMNRHDVTRWNGIEDILEELEEEFGDLSTSTEDDGGY